MAAFDMAENLFAQLSVKDVENQCDLKELQCPFTWKECQEMFNEKDRLIQLSCCFSDSTCKDWLDFSEQVFRACLLGLNKEEKETMALLEHCENFVKMEKQEKYFEDILEGVQHIIMASKYYCYLHNEKSIEASEILPTIIPFKNLSKCSQAAIWAMRSSIVRHFGYEGKAKAVEYSKIAIELDPDDYGTRRGSWYFLAGKIMSQIRRIDSRSKLPSREELMLLERSVLKNPFPVHLVSLADSYRDAARVRSKTSRRSGGIAEEMSLAAKDLYKKAIEDKDATVEVLKRCGIGFIKLRKEHRDVHLAHQCLKIALERDPNNPGVLLEMGNLYDWEKKDSITALRFYERSSECGNELAILLTIKMRYKIDKKYNPVEDCNKFISSVKNSQKSKFDIERVCTFHVIKGEFYLYVKDDLLAAAKEWKQAIAVSPKCSCLLEHPRLFSNNYYYINIYKVLRTKISKALKFKKFEKNDEIYLRNLLTELEKTSNAEEA